MRTSQNTTTTDLESIFQAVYTSDVYFESPLSNRPNIQPYANSAYRRVYVQVSTPKLKAAKIRIQELTRAGKEEREISM